MNRQKIMIDGKELVGVKYTVFNGGSVLVPADVRPDFYGVIYQGEEFQEMVTDLSDSVFLGARPTPAEYWRPLEIEASQVRQYNGKHAVFGFYECVAGQDEPLPGRTMRIKLEHIYKD